MATLEDLQLEHVIRQKIETEKWTHSQLSTFLKTQYVGTKGISVRSLQRFCSAKGIHKSSRASITTVDEAVLEAVGKVTFY